MPLLLNSQPITRMMTWLGLNRPKRPELPNNTIKLVPKAEAEILANVISDLKWALEEAEAGNVESIMIMINHFMLIRLTPTGTKCGS
jgi:hypothetical protein